MESHQSVYLVVRPGKLVSTRVIRRVRQEVYLDALKDHDMELTPLPGTTITIRWPFDDLLYEQQGVITEVLDPIPIIVVKLQGQSKVIEQRGSLRVKVQVPLEYGLIRPDSELLMTTTFDLSATGLRFPSAVELWRGLHLKMRLRLGTDEVILLSQVTRVATKPREIRGKKTWESAVTFIQIKPQDRTLIERFVRGQYHRQQTRRD
ncbi:pilus assembly protein PilZ [Sulfobacillus thermosulfidooxidans]|nr:pilus assembly protein PilZ [Sulfobacillus thermosulfidooxidans]OLZ17114.1 pilus assembly protein PilZ [Sulfobacillus thermosulfidooxidans]OLZ20314.1 pilus assembly protein PilZ [Sulfobacillus thermosulfidooxidans]